MSRQRDGPPASRPCNTSLCPVSSPYCNRGRCPTIRMHKLAKSVCRVASGIGGAVMLPVAWRQLMQETKVLQSVEKNTFIPRPARVDDGLATYSSRYPGTMLRQVLQCRYWSDLHGPVLRVPHHLTATTRSIDGYNSAWLTRQS